MISKTRAALADIHAKIFCKLILLTFKIPTVITFTHKHGLWRGHFCSFCGFSKIPSIFLTCLIVAPVAHYWHLAEKTASAQFCVWTNILHNLLFYILPFYHQNILYIEPSRLHQSIKKYYHFITGDKIVFDNYNFQGYNTFKVTKGLSKISPNREINQLPDQQQLYKKLLISI